jgi:hypothetical protein
MIAKMKTVNYYLGAGPHMATRVERPDGVFEIRMYDGKIVGYGNTAKESAVHLADQLREIARLVEAHEGQNHRGYRSDPKRRRGA